MPAMPDARAVTYQYLQRRALPNVICLSFVWWLLCLRCAPTVIYRPDPERDIDEWVQTFSQQQSFKYHYMLKTQAVMAEASGECVVGLGEHIKGVLRGDTTMGFEYVGLGDKEWSWQDGVWQERVRGEQSDFFAQITRVLEFDKFEYRGFDNGYVYDFKATVPFLSPGGWKEIRGILRISDKTFLPDNVWVGLPDSSVFWRMELSHYNKRQSISAPIKNAAHYMLVGTSSQHTSAINRRLKLLGIEHRIEEHDGTIILTVPQYYTTADVQTMLGERRLIIYGTTFSQEQAVKIDYVHGDESRPVYLADTFATKYDITDIRISFDTRLRPYMEIRLSEKRASTHGFACEVDGEIVGVTTLDRRGRIDKIRMYTSMSYHDLQVLRAVLLEPLPAMRVAPVTEDNN